MAITRFRSRGEVRSAYPLEELFDELIVYVKGSTLENARSRTVTKMQLEAFVFAAKHYALGTPNGKLDRYDVFSVVFKEIDKCTNGKPTAGVSSALHTWKLDELQVVTMFDARFSFK